MVAAGSPGRVSRAGGSGRGGKALLACADTCAIEPDCVVTICYSRHVPDYRPGISPCHPEEYIGFVK